MSDSRPVDRRAQTAASILALLTAVSIWLSAGTVTVTGGDTSRIAALPSIWILGALAIVAVAIAWLTRPRLEELWPLAISFVLWLPFLPGDLPPSILMWEGRIEYLVWFCVIAGLISARKPAMPRAFSDPAIAQWIAALVLIAGWTIAFSQVRGVLPGGDEPHYLAATQSLLHDGDLRVANNYAQGEYLDYFPGRLEPHFLKRAASGEIYSIHAPGVSIIVLPLFAIAGYLGAIATMLLIAALAAVLTWRLSFRLAGSAAAAWAGTLAVFATTPYFFHAFTIYPEIIGSFCVLCGVWLLFELADGREVSSRTLIGVGTALAVLPWLHTRFAVLAAILGVLIVLRLLARQSAITNIGKFLVVPIVAGMAWLSFFYMIWGSPSPTAPYGADTSTSASYILRGLIGLLVDQQYGVLTTAPIYVMAIAGAAVMLMRQRRLSIELASVVIPYAIAVASYAMWWAGAAAPARFIVSILPLAALPIAMLWTRSRALVLLFLLGSIALIAPRVFIDEGRFIYNNRSSYDVTLLWLTSSVDLPSALPSVHGSGGAMAIRDAAIWFAGIGVAAAFAIVAGRRWQFGAQYALTGCVMAVAVMTCTRVAWSFDDFSTFDDDRSKMETIERLQPPWQTTIINGKTWRRQSIDDLLNATTIVTNFPSSKALGRIPAGDYEITTGSAGPPDARIEFLIGRNDAPFESVPLAGDHKFQLRLPVTVRSLNLRINSAGPYRDPDFQLRPTGLIERPTDRAATHAARFGDARAFFFDEWAYPERDGFWTRSNGTALVVLDSSSPNVTAGLPISVTAGGVATTVTLSMGQWQESLSLEAGQKKGVTLPPPISGAWPLTIRSGAGFRPSDRDPGNRDVRSLAAWIAVLSSQGSE